MPATDQNTDNAAAGSAATAVRVTDLEKSLGAL